LTELSEIESSSRLRVEKDALYLSTPIVFRTESGEPVTTSVGFVLRHDLLITIRFTDLKVFRSFAESCAKPGAVHPSSAGAFIGLLEAIVDRIADVLEGIGVDLDAVKMLICERSCGRSAVPAI
jgi:magnesium transporter